MIPDNSLSHPSMIMYTYQGLRLLTDYLHLQLYNLAQLGPVLQPSCHSGSSQLPNICSPPPFSFPMHSSPFPRHYALPSSGSLPFILTLDHSASCSSPYSGLMVLSTVHPIASHLASLFIPSTLITYLPCFMRIFDTYTYTVSCTYNSLSLFLHVLVCPYMPYLSKLILACSHTLRPCIQVFFILFVLHSLLTACSETVICPLSLVALSAPLSFGILSAFPIPY